MMKVEVSISVIIPVYRVEAFIVDCAISLFEQTLDNVEYLFIDDCSPDRSVELLQQTLELYPARKPFVRIISHSCNKGIAGARNTGLQNATGEYIGWVDPDDCVESNMFELMYARAIECNADIVSCGYHMLYPTHQEEIFEPLAGERIQIIQDILEDKITAHIWNRIVRRSLYVRYKILFLEGCNLCEDRSLCLKLLSISTHISDIPIPLYHYHRNRPNSIVDNWDRSHRLSTTKNLIDAVDFISTNGTYQIEQEKMFLLKSIAKREYLKAENIDEILQWKTVFQESNHFIFVTPGLLLRHRLIGFMASHNMLFFVRLWFVLKLINNKLHCNK